LTSQYLIEEGIAIETISSGAVLNSAAFNYIKPTQILDTLAEQSGYIWQITPNKTLQFKPHTNDHFLFSMGASQMALGSIQYTEGSPQYRNVQYVVGGMNLTSTQNETEVGDSKKQAFLMKYPIMQVPAVGVIKALGTTSTGTIKTVGIRGIDSTYQWYWNKLNNTIAQQSTDNALTTTEALSVTYIGGFPSIARTEDSEGISILKSYEGGSGLVEDAVYKNMDTMYADNKTVANSLISKYSTICDTLRFKTMRSGVMPGVILKVSISDFGLSSKEFLVDNVSMSDVDGTYLWYDVTCRSGYDHGGWSKFFDALITKTVEKDIWEGASLGDILEVGTALSNTFGWGQVIATTSYNCLTPATSMFAATTNYPC